jgi:N-methylhydantoinase A
VGYARALGITTIVVPGEVASVWSAFGISQADIRYQYEASVVMLQPFTAAPIEAAFAALAEQARAALDEREDAERFTLRRYARMRFQWQLHELELRLPDEALDDERMDELARRFVAVYSERFGEAALLPGARLEIVSLRLVPAITAGAGALHRLAVAPGDHRRGRRPVWFERGQGPVQADVFHGEAMPVGEPVHGPAVIDLAITGIVLPAATSCERRASGDFVLTLHPT